MKFLTAVAAKKHVEHAVTMTVKAAAGALNYGDIVIIDTTNDDTTNGLPCVKTTTSADSALVCGVISQPGGIALNGVGEMTLMGLAVVNTATASSNFAAGAALTTSTTAGAAADGTETLLNLLGKVWYSPNDTTTTVVAWVNVL